LISSTSRGTDSKDKGKENQVDGGVNRGGFRGGGGASGNPVVLPIERTACRKVD
jgi:hypothetical protein